MCSASQPSSLAMLLAIRRAKHFFPSKEFPPYPLPNEHISLILGKCPMKSLSGLQGQWFITFPKSKGILLPVLAEHLLYITD